MIEQKIVRISTPDDSKKFLVDGWKISQISASDHRGFSCLWMLLERDDSANMIIG